MRTHQFRFVSATALALSALAAVNQAQAATLDVAATCKVSRSQILELVAKGVTPDKIHATYGNCIADDVLSTTAVGYPFSTFYEEIKACGYHSQRKEAACRVDIKQLNGYAGVGVDPFGNGGSLEFVKFCVEQAGVLVPVNTNGFHINDAAPVSGNPTWNFAAIINADQTLFARPLNRVALRARAILSWNVPPGGTCAAPTFYWGNVLDFRIRLDP
jgi:hypothetical protein